MTKLRHVGRAVPAALAAIIASLIAPLALADTEDQAPVYTAINIYPPRIALQTRDDAQRLIVIATDENGVQHDVTGRATLSAEAPVLELHENVAHPLEDGATNIIASLGDHRALCAATVENASANREISFRLDIMPTFMAGGCNSGGCHGSARGQDGFRLSLFGFDPAGDYNRITREMAGRRLNLAQPEQSLLLRKAIGDVIHTGGQRFTDEAAAYATIRRWIAAGAPNDGDNLARVVDIRMYPPQTVLQGEGAQCALVVVADYSDGTSRDVTDLAVFRTSNETSGDVLPGGLVTAAARGEAFVTAAFDTFTVGSPFIVLPSDAGAIDKALAESGENPVDQHINRKLAQLRITPSPQCSDEVFLRRVYIDIIGLLPTPDERAAFLQSEALDKRAQLIDALLERREFIDQWVMQWAELLQIRSTNEISYKAALAYFEWLRENFTNDVPVDEITRRILTASGGTFSQPATNFYLNQQENNVLAENVAQAFMGIRIQCAQCHNHPFDRWTQNDYYGFVSFFTQLGRKRAEDRRETIVFNRRSGEMNHPVTGAPQPPTFLGGEQPDIARRDRRAVVAEWITSPENEYFAPSLVNRIWAHFMGVGIVEPVDDFRISNPPSNAALLDHLAGLFVESGYDIKAIVRAICNSAAYQRATAVNETNASVERNFSHALVRRPRAETLLDMISQVTDAPQKFRGLPLGARAVEIADGTTSTYFLSTFGRAERGSVCSCEVVREPSLSQALHLLNGDATHGKIQQGKVIESLIAEGYDDAAIVDALYARCLARPPTEQERTALLAFMPEKAENEDAAAGAAARLTALQDIFWAVLNSREFVFNH